MILGNASALRSEWVQGPEEPLPRAGTVPSQSSGHSCMEVPVSRAWTRARAAPLTADAVLATSSPVACPIQSPALGAAPALPRAGFKWDSPYIERQHRLMYYDLNDRSWGQMSFFGCLSTSVFILSVGLHSPGAEGRWAPGPVLLTAVFVQAAILCLWTSVQARDLGSPFV